MKDAGVNRISIVIVTYNRKPLLMQLLASLKHIKYLALEIIVVDNHSDELISTDITVQYPNIIVFRTNENLGPASGRNKGILLSTGDIIITLDDDIMGIDDATIERLVMWFKSDNAIGAICFKVTDPEDGGVVNWCHHYQKAIFSERIFITNEISEGAVAFRKSVFNVSGLYPEEYFISHEGPDLACRLINNGYVIIYDPQIVVKHLRSKLARPDWRRYYYDTRNLIWLIVKNYTVWYGFKKLSIGLISMLVYSIRDGYTKYWFKGIWDGIKGITYAYKKRCRMTKETLALMKQIDKHRTPFLDTVKSRILRKGVEI
jgi:GT2 family glycosyltransferase